MSTLWTQAMAHQAMPWQVHPGEEDIAHHATHVKDAGFAGFVQHPSYNLTYKRAPHKFNHDLWNKVEPEPTDEDFHHFDQHGSFSPEHHERHKAAYADAVKAEHERDKPDHHDPDLLAFARSDAMFPDTWHHHGTKGPVDISKGVFATQSHVNQAHINRYKDKPDDKSWYEHNGGRDTAYEGTRHPLFVTHQGRLHVIEGHHRVAAAIQRGDTHIEGWHYNMDEKGNDPWGDSGSH